jgi:hypothetical protein
MFNGVESPRVISYTNGNNYYTDGNDLDFSGYILEFHNDSAIILGNNSYTFGDIVNNQGSYCIDWDDSVDRPSAIAFSSQSTIMDNFNFTGTVEPNKYGRFIGYLRANGVFNLTWLEGSYVFSSTISIDGKLINHRLVAPRITFNTPVPFGHVVSASQGVFVNTSTSSPILYNSEINVGWFGAIPNVTTSGNANAFEMALESCGSSGGFAPISNGNALIGEGEYFLDRGIDFTSGTSTDNIVISGISFKGDGNTTFVTKYSVDFLMYINCNSLELRNVTMRITSPQDASGLASDALITRVSDSNFSVNHKDNYCIICYENATESETSVVGCHFGTQTFYRAIRTFSESTLINSNTFQSMEGDTAFETRYGIDVDSVDATVSGNICTGGAGAVSDAFSTCYVRASDALTISGNNFGRTSLIVDCNNTASGMMTGNTFKETPVEIITPDGFGVIGNSFTQGATIPCSVLLTDTQPNFMITNNNFRTQPNGAVGTPRPFFETSAVWTPPFYYLNDNNLFDDGYKA